MTFKLTPSFKKRLDKKTHAQAGAIMECIHRLENNPNHPGLHRHRVQGTRDIWQARVDQGNRLTFRYEGDVVVLLNHCNHDVLRNPG